MPYLKKLAVIWLIAFTALGVPIGAQAQQDGSGVALASLRNAPGDSPLLGENVEFSLQVIHSVKFSLTAERCYYQFFVDALGSSPLSEVRFDIELAHEGRIVAKTQATVADLDGRRVSKRIREFAFDGPCQLDGIRIVEAVGSFENPGLTAVLNVNLFERNAVSTQEFEPLDIALGLTSRLPGAALAEVPEASGLNSLERGCIVRASNLRTGPGTEFNIVTILEPGMSVFVEKRTGDGTWNRVRTQFGRQGWIYYTLLGSCPS